MKKKNLISLLLALCLSVSMLSAASALEAGDASSPISEKEFAVLLKAAFPTSEEAAQMTSDLPVTYGRALVALCGALGRTDQSNASRLAFAIENDLITGIAAVSSHQVSREDAQKLIASFAAYRDAQILQAIREDALFKAVFTRGAAMPQMAGLPAPADGASILSVPFPAIDCNAHDSPGQNEVSA